MTMRKYLIFKGVEFHEDKKGQGRDEKEHHGFPAPTVFQGPSLCGMGSYWLGTKPRCLSSRHTVCVFKVSRPGMKESV